MALGNAYPAEFEDDTQAVRLHGTLQFTDSGSQPGDATIAAVSSDDGSIDVVAPSGPTVDLSVVDSPAVGGITVTGTPTAGQVLKATSASAADWAAPTGLPTGWTQAGDPADVDTNGGTFTVKCATGDDGLAVVDHSNVAILSVGEDSGGATVTGNLSASGFAQAAAVLVTGLTGAVSATRYAGGTADVAPTSGTFGAGDWVVSLTGKVWVCTVGGTPGTWVQANSASFAPLASPTFTGTVTVPAAAAVNAAPRINQLTSALTITSGTLPNLGAWSSGTAIQNPVARQITVNVAMVSSGTAATATCAIAISPDNVTYTTIGTPTVSTAVNTVGALQLVTAVNVPAAWYIKLTFSNATVAASIYY